MKSVDQLIDEVIVREGGSKFTNHSADRGGPTKYGITQKTLSAYLGKPVSAEDVKNLERKLAEEIYEQEYYHKPKLDMLPDAYQSIMFDMCVNHGAKAAVTLLQHAIRIVGYPDIKVDGKIGSNTAQYCYELYKKHGVKFINVLVQAREDLYEHIVKRDPSQQVFLNGWKKRNKEFKV